MTDPTPSARRDGISATESDIQNTIRDTLVWDGWMVLRLNSGAMKPEEGERYVKFYEWLALGHPPSSAGAPDLLAMRGNRVAAIEVKDARGQQRDTQHAFELACRDCGVEYILARDLADVAHLLSRVEYDGDGKRYGMRAVEVTND